MYAVSNIPSVSKFANQNTIPGRKYIEIKKYIEIIRKFIKK